MNPRQAKRAFIDTPDIWVTARDIPDICELTGAHRTTVARWITSKRFPVAVARLLDLIYNGNLAVIHADWNGFRVNPRTGELDTPLKRSSTAGEILAIPYRYQLIANLQAELRQVTGENARTYTDQLALTAEVDTGGNVVPLKAKN